MIRPQLASSAAIAVFATGKSQYTWDKNSEAFAAALQLVFKDLAHQIVKDGEGATKFVEIEVTGAETGHAAKNIAMRRLGHLQLYLRLCCNFGLCHQYQVLIRLEFGHLQSTY